MRDAPCSLGIGKREFRELLLMRPDLRLVVGALEVQAV
jgi:hypothetical protein